MLGLSRVARRVQIRTVVQPRTCFPYASHILLSMCVGLMMIRYELAWHRPAEIVRPCSSQLILPVYILQLRCFIQSKCLHNSSFDMLVPHLAPALTFTTPTTTAIHFPTPNVPAYQPTPPLPTPTNLKDCTAPFGVPGAVYLCPLPNFEPVEQCTWHTSDAASCIAFGDLPEWTQSLGPDPGGFCELFATSNCTGGTVAYLDNEHKFYKNE